MPSIDFAQLRAQVTMGQVLELLHYEPRVTEGAQVRGPCPIHGSTSKTSRIFSANLQSVTFSNASNAKRRETSSTFGPRCTKCQCMTPPSTFVPS